VIVFGACEGVSVAAEKHVILRIHGLSHTSGKACGLGVTNGILRRENYSEHYNHSVKTGPPDVHGPPQEIKFDRADGGKSDIRQIL
jgi:hypothetical protein